MDKKPAFVPHHQAPSSLFPQQLDPPEPIKKNKSLFAITWKENLYTNLYHNKSLTFNSVGDMFKIFAGSNSPLSNRLASSAVFCRRNKKWNYYEVLGRNANSNFYVMDADSYL